MKKKNGWVEEHSHCHTPLESIIIYLSVRAQWTARSFEFFHRNSNSNICLKNILYEYQPLFVGIFAAGQLPDFTYYRFDEYGHFVIYRLSTGLFHGFFLNCQSTFFCRSTSFSLNYYPFSTLNVTLLMDGWKSYVHHSYQLYVILWGSSIILNNSEILVMIIENFLPYNISHNINGRLNWTAMKFSFNIIIKDIKVLIDWVYTPCPR